MPKPTSAPPRPDPESRSLAEAYDVALLDLDGVVYVGDHEVPYASAAVTAARSQGMRFAFVTNNAARTSGAVAAHLRDLGLPADAAEVVTSSHAAAGLLLERFGAGAKILVIGGDGLIEALRERDLVPAHSLDEQPQAVVQGFHPSVGWPMLAEGAYAVARGLPWLATNADATLPTPRGEAPGNGSLIAVIRTATGATPEVAGKPEAQIFREAINRANATRPLVVGDRLDTDIAGANNARLDSLLVLTGVSTAADTVLARPEHRPTYVAHDLRALSERADAVIVAPGRAAVGGCTAQIDGTELRMAGDGEALDAVRAACGAVWAGDARSHKPRVDADSVHRELARYV